MKANRNTEHCRIELGTTGPYQKRIPLVRRMQNYTSPSFRSQHFEMRSLTSLTRSNSCGQVLLARKARCSIMCATPRSSSVSRTDPTCRRIRARCPGRFGEEDHVDGINVPQKGQAQCGARVTKGFPLKATLARFSSSHRHRTGRPGTAARNPHSCNQHATSV